MLPRLEKRRRIYEDVAVQSSMFKAYDFEYQIIEKI